MRTQVGIVGAGPAGLLLAQLLHLHGVDTVILERRSREYVEGRIRAGVLEQGTVDLLLSAGLGERLRREGLIHEGIELRFERRRLRIPLRELTGGRAITIYGQQKVVEDLLAARLQAGGLLYFDVRNVDVAHIDAAPRIHRYDATPEERAASAQFWRAWLARHGRQFTLPDMTNREAAVLRWLTRHNLPLCC